jgi:hypothetical protein
MMGSDVSHLSQRRLDTCTQGIGLDLFSDLFPLCSVILGLLLSRSLSMFISLPVGPHRSNR